MNPLKLAAKARTVAALLTPAGWAVAGGSAIVAVALACWLITTPARQHQAAAEAHADVVITGAQQKAASDAVAVVVGSAARETAIDQTTRDNRDAILSAPGAAAPVDPAVGDAGRRSICLRQSAAGDPACQRLLHTRP